MKKTENDAGNKPTILDIISETEKNQTKMNSPRFTQQSDVLNHRSSSVGHPGVAEPLTWQQLEREMVADQKLRDTSTSKEGISTWILLSGSDQQTSSSPTPSATTISAQVEKLEVQVPAVTDLPKRNNFRFQESYQTKIDKIGKIRDAIERRQSKPEKKSKPTPSSTLATTTLITSTTTEAAHNTPSTTEQKVQRRKNPSFVQISKLNKQKPARTTTTMTTTTAETTEKAQEDELTTIVSYIQGLGSGVSTEEGGSTTTAVPFLVLEPKDADFDLPQDRSPGPTKKNKRPNPPTKTKKKNSNKNAVSTSNPNKKNPNTKIALNKQKEKPITTKIYNYLSREVMPTVGVGLVGLVVTAGLASYFFGPLGALRRSYDDAMDRQDTGDNIYAVNSDEYAGGNPDAGQNEEEVFGKFIAGMPANYMPKYVRYYQPHGPQPSHVQGHGPQGPHPYPGTRRIYVQPTGGPNHGNRPQQHFFRNRNGAEVPYPKVSPSPHYQQQHYQQQQPALRNHQPQPQQPLASPYLQQLHDLQMQKSLSTNIESALKQHTFEGETNGGFKDSAGEEAPATPRAVTEETHSEAPVAVVTAINPESLPDTDSSNQIQRRIAHYVVGSVLPESKPESEQPSANSSPSVVSSPEIITATHGPRRRRSLRKRRQADVVEVAEARFLQTRSNVESELEQIDVLFKQLQDKINRLSSNQTEKFQNTEKINKEFNRTEANVQLLHLVVDHIKDIEKFQKEFYIKSKNWELAMTLKTGMNHIRNQIILVSDLIEHPNDENLIRRIEQNDSSPSESSTAASSDAAATQPNVGPPAHFSPFDDLLKLIQLKALFGINLLQNIRPSFERAFEEVFRMPAKAKSN